MSENSSQTLKELPDDKEIKNSSELDKNSGSSKQEDLSYKMRRFLQQILPQVETMILIMQDLLKKNLHHYSESMIIILNLVTL